MYVLIDFADETLTEITNVTGPFATEEEADAWDEGTGQRWGKHVILPIHDPKEN